MIPLSSAVLDRLETLDQNATKGPWELYAGEHGRQRRYWDVLALTGDPDITTLTVAEMADLRDDAVNAELIAEVRNALPQLIQMAKAYQQIAAMEPNIQNHHDVSRAAGNHYHADFCADLLATLPPPPAPSETP